MTKFTPFLKRSLAKRRYLTTYFKLRMQACTIFLTAIVKICSITCHLSFSFLSRKSELVKKRLKHFQRK